MSFSTNHLFIVGPQLAPLGGDTGVDAGSWPAHGSGVHQHIPVVTSEDARITEPTPANSAASSSDSSFEDLISELERVHLNSTGYHQESAYHTADSFEQLFRSKVP